VGPIGEDKLVTLQDLRDALHYYRTEGNEKYIRYCVRPIESAIAHIPKFGYLILLQTAYATVPS
jgi:H/ACA ribonucleoprotein complex subunit 4